MQHFNAVLVFDRRVITNVGEIFCSGTRVGSGVLDPTLWSFLSLTYLYMSWPRQGSRNGPEQERLAHGRVQGPGEFTEPQGGGRCTDFCSKVACCLGEENVRGTSGRQRDGWWMKGAWEAGLVL